MMREDARGMLALEIVEHSDQLVAEEWDALCSDRPFVRHRWLRLTEQVLRSYTPRYVLLRRAGRLEAGAICSIRNQFQNHFLRTTANWALERFPCLRVGLPITFDSGLLVRPGADASVLPALIGALQRYARQVHASFIGVDHLAGADPAWPLLEQARYHRAELLTETFLEIGWPSLEVYMRELPKKKRQRIRQIQRRAEQEGITIALEPLSAETAALLRPLVSDVFQRHGEPDTYIADLFPTAQAVLGDDFALAVARRHDQIVGGLGLMFSQGDIAAKWIGLDYQRTLNTSTYLAINVALIELAIARGARRLRMGATSYETKHAFGALDEPRFSGLMMRSRVLNAVAGAALHVTGGKVAALPQPGSAAKPKTA